jgi:hypothetical protein
MRFHIGAEQTPGYATYRLLHIHDQLKLLRAHGKSSKWIVGFVDIGGLAERYVGRSLTENETENTDRCKKQRTPRKVGHGKSL